MKKCKFFISFVLAIVLSLSPLGSVVNAQEVNNINAVNAQEINKGNVSNIQIEDPEYGLIDLKTIVKEEKVITKTYNGDELLSKTIVYKTDGRIEEFDNLGNKQTFYIEDYIKNADGTKVDPSIFAESNIYNDKESNDNLLQKSEISIMSTYSIPSGYEHVMSEYSSTWEAWGDLFKNTTRTYGQQRIFEFSKGTKVSTVISILTAIGNFNVYATLISIGISIIGAAIDSYNRGTFQTITVRDDLIVVVNRKLGLQTYKARVSAFIYSQTTGKQSIELIRTEGSALSYSDMIHMGIYNIVALGW